MPSRMNSSNAETEVKSSVSLPGYNEVVRQRKVKKTFVGEEMSQRRVGTAPAWFRPFQGEHSWWNQPPSSRLGVSPSPRPANSRREAGASIRSKPMAREITADVRFPTRPFTAAAPTGAGAPIGTSLAPCQKPRFVGFKAAVRPCRAVPQGLAWRRNFKVFL